MKRARSKLSIVLTGLLGCYSVHGASLGWQCTQDTNEQWVCVSSQSPQQFEANKINKLNKINGVNDFPIRSNLLNWIVAPNANLCGGYYSPMPIPTKSETGQLLLPGDLYGSANQVTDSRYSNPSIWQENVRILQKDELLITDKAFVYRNLETGRYEYVDVEGNVQLYRPGEQWHGQQGRINLINQTAEFQQVNYQFALPNKNLNARGRAKQISQLAPGVSQGKTVRYTTCSPGQNTWELRMAQLDLDKEKGRGVAKHARIYVKGVPVFYTPYFRFPIDDRRQSGFLNPTFGTSRRDGTSVSLPYYFNLASNYDLVLTPRYMSTRGTKLNSQFRYLTSNSRGSVYAAYLPNDRAMPGLKRTLRERNLSAVQLARVNNTKEDRQLLFWENKTRWTPKWSTDVTFHYVGDDYYFQDFDDLNTSSSNYTFARQVDVNYKDTHWNGLLRVQDYQTLHPANQSAVTNPYARLPQLSLTGNYPEQALGLNYTLKTEFVHFYRHKEKLTSTVPSMTANRFNLQPTVSLPLAWNAGFLTPKAEFFITHYSLQNQTAGEPSEITRFASIYSVEGGLFFERDFSLFSTELQQTLEPKVMYAYAPFVSQSDIPKFDSSLTSFSYSQLFRTNRFSGTDRIGDTNQLSMALISRVLATETSNELVQASIGQLVYFTDRRVDANAGNNKRLSPLVGDIAVNLNSVWTTSSSATWNHYDRRVTNAKANVQYAPEVNKLINVGYNFIINGDKFSDSEPTKSSKNNLKRLEFSTVWPLTKNWSVLGQWKQNISHGYKQDYLFGFIYETCCWAFRAVHERHFLSRNQQQIPVYDAGYYIQFALKGLTSFGGGTTRKQGGKLLQDKVVGYVDHFDDF